MCRRAGWVGLLVLSAIGCNGSGAVPAKVEINKSAPTEAVASRQPDVIEPTPVEDSSQASQVAAQKAFAELLAASEDSDFESWATAEQALSGLGSAAVPTLAAHLADENPFARELAVQFLAQLGPEAAAAEKELTAALADTSPMVRVNAAASLLAMNESTEAAEEVLKELISSDDPTVRLPAAISLAGFDSTSTDALAALAELLSDSSDSIRLAAVQALGRLGEKAKASLTAVRQLTAETNPEIRTAAQQAARQIEGGVDETSETIPVGGVEQ